MYWIKRLFVCMGASLLIACGGGGGGDDTPPQNDDPSSPPASPPPTSPPPEPPEVPPSEDPTPFSASRYSDNPHETRFFGDQDLTQYYELFDHSAMPRIDVTITESEWDAFLADITRNIASKTYFNASASITTSSGETSLDNVGFRIRGNTTRRIPERNGNFFAAHFKLKFNETFSMPPGSIAYAARNDRRFANMRSMNLKSPSISNDAPYMRELYAYDLFNQVGVNAPLTNNVRLYINIGGQRVDYGVYTLVEPVDKSFLRKRFGDDNNEGNLYKCLWQAGGPATLEPFNVANRNIIGLENNQGFKPTYDLKTNKGNPSHIRMDNFVDAIDSLTGNELKTYFDENFEVDKFLLLLAVNVLVGMPDDYWGMGNNYYLYFPPTGKIEMFPFDYDHSFGQGWRPIDTAQVNVLNWWNGVRTISGNSTPRPLISKIMSVSDYRLQYIQYLKDFVDPNTGHFNFPEFQSKYNQVKNLIDPDGDNNAFGRFFDLDENISIDGIAEYYDLKIQTVNGQLDD